MQWHKYLKLKIIDRQTSFLIKVQRAILGLTQDDLAKKIGVSRQTINSIEKNRYVPSTVLALKLSTIFNIPVNDFFTLEEED